MPIWKDLRILRIGRLKTRTRVKGFSWKKNIIWGVFVISKDFPENQNHKIVIPDYLIWLFWPPKPSPSVFLFPAHLLSLSLCIFQLLTQTLILALPIHTPMYTSVNLLLESVSPWIVSVASHRFTSRSISLSVSLFVFHLRDSSLRSLIVPWNFVKYQFVEMAESKLDLPEDLMTSKPSDQSWIPKGKSLFLISYGFFAPFDLLQLFGFGYLMLDTVLWYIDLYRQCNFQFRS